MNRSALLRPLAATALTAAMVVGLLAPAASASADEPTWRTALGASSPHVEAQLAAESKQQAAAWLDARAADVAAGLSADAGTGYADGDRPLVGTVDGMTRGSHAAAVQVQTGLNEDARSQELLLAGRSLLAAERRTATTVVADAVRLAVTAAEQAAVRRAQEALAQGDGKAATGDVVPAVNHYTRAIETAVGVVVSQGVGYDDTADLDGDGLPDLAELRGSADPRVADTDGDGLGDLFEVTQGAPYHRADQSDTDGDGVPDGESDVDGDDLTALAEQAAGSNPLNPDTDDDGLDDPAERDAGTSPVAPDTDQDGLRDGAEDPAGTDPLLPDTDGDGVLDGEEVLSTTYVDEAGVTVELTGLGDLASHLRVDPLTDDALLGAGRGQVSTAYEILLDPEVRGRLTSARITVPFDPATLDADVDVEDLRLFTFDEELSAWVPGAPEALQLVDPAAGTVTATVEHFSVYAIFDISNWRTRWTGLGGTCTPTGSGGDVLVDVAFVLDASGSMSSNDPQGLRRTAAKNFVDALTPEDRGAVVRFASSASLLQGLTSDQTLLRAAIDRVNASGGTNIGAGVDVALDELDRGRQTGRAEVLILLTDGSGSYSTALTDRAAADGVTVYTIGLGRAVNASLLQTIAERTGGEYYAVDDAEDLPEVFRVIEQDTGDDGRDTDEDGISDCDETQGVVDSATGQRFTSDPRLADTDGDGLTDGHEVGMAYDLARVEPLLGTGQVYRVRSDPRQADTDSDGLSDLDELYALTRARSADTDGDGLGDGYEDGIGTDPFFADTDLDDLDDRFEHLNEDLGYDPLVEDVQLTVWDYAGDFSRGALCGDKSGVWGFCDGDSLPYLAGNLTAGFVGVGDVRDALANLVDGEYASAALSVAFLIPVVGDGASVAAKIIKHIDKLSPPARKRALSWVMKQDLPDVVKLKVLDDVHGADALQRLRGQGLDDAKLLDLARRGQDLRVLDDAVTGAARAVPSPGRYGLERDAQEWLQRQVPGSRMEVYQPPSGGVNSRRIDVYADATRQATEVKKGVVRYSSKVKREVDNDVRNLDDPEVAVDGVDWQFFPDADGKVGPSEELLARLRTEGIPYTIWLP